MVKRILKRILVFSSVACLVLACVPTISFAVDPVSGAMALAGAMDAYGMAYGVGTVYDVSSSSGVTSSFEGLWDDFSSYQSNAGSQFDYDSFMDDYNQNRSLYGFEHSSGKFAAWYIDAESAEVFDQFWNWLLTGPAEMTRVDNEYFEFSQSQIGPESTPINVGNTYSSNQFPGQPITQIASYNSMNRWNSFVMSGPTPSNSSPYPDYSTIAAASSGTIAYVCFIRSNNHYEPLAIFPSSSLSGSVRFQIDYGGTRKEYSSVFPHNQYQNTDWYYSNFLTWSSGWHDCIDATVAYSSVAPVFSDIATAIYQLGLSVDPIVTESVGVKAYGNGYVNIPDPTKPDYAPTPLEIVTNVPWDSTYDDTDDDNGTPVPFPPADVPNVVDDIISSISAEDYALEVDPNDPDPDPPPPAPSEVFVPLLPVGLPSFNFSFSGIWHYVREWVASLGAWFTTLFTIWGALPYAMVVPVFATAVVVIVLGVYKRFFM